MGAQGPAWLINLIRDIPDFPQPGVVFKDITPLLAEPQAFGAVVDELVRAFRFKTPQKVLGIEARGFIVAAPVAYRLGAGLVPARKKGKLPWETYGVDYELEYGSERLEVHRDGVGPGDRVLVVDDVLATGGTAAAAAGMARSLGAEVVGVGVVIELGFLNPRSKLAGLDVHSLVVYDAP